MTSQQSDARPAETAAATGLQFSIRALMIATLAVGCWLGMLRIVPHIAIFILGVFLAGLSLLLVIRLRRRQGEVLSRLLAYAFAIVAWFFFYVVSIGPVVAFNEHFLHFGDNIFVVVYAPVIWLHDATLLAEPLEQYAALWGWQ